MPITKKGRGSSSIDLLMIKLGNCEKELIAANKCFAERISCENRDCNTEETIALFASLVVVIFANHLNNFRENDTILTHFHRLQNFEGRLDT